MKENQVTILCAERLAPPAGLLMRILRRVDLEKARHIVRRALLAWSCVAAVATAGLATAGIFFYKEAATSGLGTYLNQFWALASTNPSLLLAHLSEILTSIGESLPATTLAVAAVAIGVVLWSAEKVIGFSKRYTRVAY